ncbi:Sterol O-acyltransferase 2 (Sterol-ester synthase 2) [Vermiconidia calcicola]|uniref:Sterol O-acyltransferase 2 (Sterol-ester synthase 2) n=1 Tax=Vermiconidia calcicola TaxID=1690605 RepID=A0ACC3MTR3_9PEZI|nr:Sterol O-acyltransferase 2 (Sterol-ester synthase 2) [Vermiconidia calcicola]
MTSARKDSGAKPELSGEFDQLHVNSENKPNGTTGEPSANGTHVHASMSKSETQEALDDETSSDGIEDYDDLELDPDTLVANSRRTEDEGYRPSGRLNLPDDTAKREESEPVGVLDLPKRNSIQISLQKTDRKGRYTLTADDPEFKEILRKGIERQEIEAGSRKPRVRMRDLVFTPQLTTFDRRSQSSSESPFFGFFTLFWIAMALLFVQFSMRNYRDYGSILGTNQMMKIMFSHDLFLLGITDGVMCVATAQTLVFQKMVHKGWLRWEKGGWLVQNLWQSLYLAAIVGWTYFREWPWTHTFFVTMHGLIFVMKQHSHAFYNGYLAGVYRRRALLESKLKQLDHLEPVHSPPTSPVSLQRLSHYATGIDTNGSTSKPTSSQAQQRPLMGARTTTNLGGEDSDVASVAQAIESSNAIDSDQMKTFERIIEAEINDLSRELNGKSTDDKNQYPKNLTFGNFFDYICLPTVVYELEYPRQERINWWYVLEKTTATFGVLCVMMVISQAFIYPPVAKTVRMKEAGMPIEQRWQEFPFIVSDMLFPLLIEQLLSWYLIWECILNVLAELTCFADRGFYGDWWNSVTFEQYARNWNRPVHNFLLRHVYHSSISTFHLSRNAATFVTFLLSALVHEMLMALLFKKVRGYLFWSQLLQLPMVMMSKSKLMRDRAILGNVIFWMGMFVGPSFLTSLYLIV